jgi:hypothetical protein
MGIQRITGSIIVGCQELAMQIATGKQMSMQLLNAPRPDVAILLRNHGVATRRDRDFELMNHMECLAREHRGLGQEKRRMNRRAQTDRAKGPRDNNPDELFFFISSSVSTSTSATSEFAFAATTND